MVADEPQGQPLEGVQGRRPPAPARTVRPRQGHLRRGRAPARRARRPKLGSVESIARLAGDPAKGKVLAGTCLACHRLGDQGIEYGPDLTAYGRNQSRENVILGIAQPDAEISHGYEGWRLVTTEGVVINGVVLSSADPVIVKSMGGLVQTVPRSRIKELAPLRRSLMFHPSQMGLNEQAVADLAAYLKSL